MEDLVAEYKKHDRYLIYHIDVEENGSLAVITAFGAHMTYDAVLQALEERKRLREKKNLKSNLEEMKDTMEYLEFEADVLYLSELAGCRCRQHMRLDSSRLSRQMCRSEKASIARH